MSTHVFTRHRDIQNWVAGHQGLPAIQRVPDSTGTVKSRLALSFAHHHAAPTTTPTLDDGITPVSWNAWLAELDRQHLALRVSPDHNYEFVKRQDLNSLN